MQLEPTVFPNQFLLKIRDEVICTRLLNNGEALPLKFINRTGGHRAVLARDLSGKIIYFDPQTQKFLEGFKQLGEYMLNNKFKQAFVIVPQTLAEASQQIGFTRTILITKKEYTIKADRPQEGFERTEPFTLHLALPPDPVCYTWSTRTLIFTRRQS